MKCPKCNFQDKNDTNECARCGVIFAKYFAIRKRRISEVQELIKKKKYQEAIEQLNDIAVICPEFTGTCSDYKKKLEAKISEKNRHVINESSVQLGNKQSTKVLSLQDVKYKFLGAKSGIEINNGNVHLWNKFASSDVEFPAEDITNVIIKPTGIIGTRGWMCVQTVSSRSTPTSTINAMSHPMTVVFPAFGKADKARQLLTIVSEHLKIQSVAEKLEKAGVIDPFGKLDAAFSTHKDVLYHLEALRPQLKKGEFVEELVLGIYESKFLWQDAKRLGIMIATNMRLAIFGKKSFGGFEFTSFYYDQISSVEINKGILGHQLAVTVSNNIITMTMINFGDIDRLLESMRIKMGPPSVQQKNDNANYNEDFSKKIKELSALKEEGLITQEEFVIKKKQILGI